MISLLRFKGRRVTTLVLRGAACLMLTVSSLSLMVGLGCVVGRPPRLTGHCLAPDGLNSRAPTLGCPHHPSETSATLRCVGPDVVTPSPQNTLKGGKAGHVAASAARVITRRRMQCQSGLASITLS